MVEIRRNQPVKLYGDGHRAKWKGRVLVSGGEGRNHTSMPYVSERHGNTVGVSLNMRLVRGTPASLFQFV